VPKALFHNYGLWWTRSDFERVHGIAGKRRKKHEKAKLLLIGKGKDTGRLVNFGEQIGVYILYDHHEEIIYVGLAGRGKDHGLQSRLSQHIRNDREGRIAFFSWFGLKAIIAAKQNFRIAHQDEIIEAHRLKSGIRATTYSIDKSTLIQHLEAVLLEITEPAKNKRGPDWKGAERFYPYEPRGRKKTKLEAIKEDLESALAKLAALH